MDYKIKVASISDMSWIIKMAETEGWMPGINDSGAFFQADPQGFYVGFLDSTPISCISAVKYHNFSFIGLYIVDQKYRNKGYGYQIWQHAINQVKHLNLGLDGVIDQQKNYQKSSFKLAYRNIRFQGKITPQALSPNEKSKIVSAQSIPFNLLVDYDSLFFLEKRPYALASWLKLATQHAYVYVENGQIKGFGAIRACVNDVYKIGPLFAENSAIAESLFFALSSNFSKHSIIIDCPEPNKNALKPVEQLGFKSSFETARMYTNKVPKTDLSQTYGISSFELG